MSKPGEPGFDFDYPEDTYITETGTGTIDADYINTKFVKFLKNLYLTGKDGEQTKAALKELHKTFATLSQKDQRTATLVLHDIQSGDLKPEPGKTIFDYIAEYQLREANKLVAIMAEATGLNISQLQHLVNSKVSEGNINDFNRYELLKLTANPQKVKTFVEKVIGKEVPLRMLMIKFDDLLRDFILDAIMRDNIIKAYLNDDLTIETVTATIDVEGETQTPDETQTEDSKEDEETHVDEKELIKIGIIAALRRAMGGAEKGMRSFDEIVKYIFYVLDASSIQSLDGIKIHLYDALRRLFCGTPNHVDKHVAGNTLIMRVEPYLKKLYYLSNGCEVPPQHEGEDVTWKNVIYAVHCLWDLKYSEDPAKRQLSHYLENVKNWRNNEAHISTTATEQEIENVIDQVLCIYAYATGMSIVEMESQGHDADNPEAYSQHQATIIQMKPDKNIYPTYEDEEKEEKEFGYMAANERICDLPEEKRIELLKTCIKATQGYKGSVFTKTRHWISIYRIAVDKGFMIENDFDFFVMKIKAMELENMPSGLSRDYLERAVTGLYANSYIDWSSEGLQGRKLNEYLDIHRAAEAFKRKIEVIHPTE